MQQQRHPLEIPEILALVGSFLPLWVYHNPMRPSIASACFEPRTLVTCFRVSKLWHETLLPILWYGYWSWLADMRDIPATALHRNSHHLRVLYLNQHTTGDINLILLNCTNLVDLDIYVEERRQEPGEGAMTSLLPIKRLLRSNRQLKTLKWTGVGVTAPLLDADDFVGLTGLENLTLTNWDCSNGRLSMVLRNVAGSLKELSVERLYNVDSVFLSSPPLPPTTTTLSQLQAESHANMDTGCSHRAEELILSRLESLIWCIDDLDNSDGLSLSEVAKRSPMLKTLVSFVRHSEKSVTRLAESLGTSCPNIQSLELHGIFQTHKLETLIRHCSPDRPQLRRLNIEVQTLVGGQDLLTAILRHASTLEQINIHRGYHGGAMDASVCIRLLAECPRLTHFAFFARLPPFNLDFLEMLKQEQQQEAWRCRETLQELRLDFEFFYLNRRQTDVERQDKTEMLSEMGWEIVDKDEEDDEPIVGAWLRETLELVRFQKLEKLQMLILNQMQFRRISPVRK